MVPTLGRYQQLESVTEMLKDINGRTLQQGRVDACITMVYRISNNLATINPGDNLHSLTRRSGNVHDHSFVLISTRTTSHRLSFYPRTIVQWNYLPPDVLLSPLILLSSGPVCLELPINSWSDFEHINFFLN